MSLFDGFRTFSKIEWIDNEESFGFLVVFSEKGFGFGEVFIGVDKATGEPKYDPEDMKPETVARLVGRVVGTVVLDGRISEDTGNDK